MPGKFNGNRTVWAQISNRITEQQIAQFAKEIRDSKKEKYDRTFIFLILPHQKAKNNEAWATCHFTPELEIRILGNTQEEYEKMSSSLNIPEKDIIGKWINDFIIKRTIIYHKKNNKKYITLIDPTGKKQTFEVVETAFRGRTILKPKKDFLLTYGAYLSIGNNGDLIQWDDEGEIRRFKNLR